MTLEVSAHVSAVKIVHGIVSMGIVLAVVPVKSLQSHNVLSVLMHFIDPLAGSEDICSLLAGQDCWPLMFEYLGIRVDTDDKNVPKALRLSDCIVVARMNKVKAPIDVDSYRLSLCDNLMMFRFIFLLLVKFVNELINLICLLIL